MPSPLFSSASQHFPTDLQNILNHKPEKLKCVACPCHASHVTRHMSYATCDMEPKKMG